MKLIKKRKLEEYRHARILRHGHPFSECESDDVLCWIMNNLLSTDRGTKALRAEDRNAKMRAKRYNETYHDWSTTQIRRMYARKTRPNR